MQEDIFILIESRRLDFTSVEQVIADYFLNKKPALSIDKLSCRLAVSKSSITRFCKKVGLDNYKELIFLYKLSREVDDSGPSASSKITAAYHALATRSDSSYSQEVVDAFCELLHRHKIIHFFGKGFNSYAGADFQFKFSRVGKYVRVISDDNSIMMSAHSARKDELIVVSSLRGNDDRLKEAMELAKANGVSISLITSNRFSQLIPYADVELMAAGFTRQEALGSISPQIPILIQLDIVYERYIHLYAGSLRQWSESEVILRQ
ncbi:transcriptional regulator, RpiR family [Coriobacterium glomerans PW2]|uniref:Transcriptional regulator, RpiR family n=1 Tax=Coriobacterium glomerans (strain ATCC 49209 / DSM 20642 / JCM 10262 / PW2) TaxID=700015 RepID=F2N9L6_CORGP|nr:MurR/RpiR family transcriptional regulator [Coriobacterium glomerans]AEB07045.1 transcriptional regulator, RpiR family [Coriobacterium glomerans PW2]